MSEKAEIIIPVPSIEAAAPEPKKEEGTEFLEIETKYRADKIDRLKFKEIGISLQPKSFLYVESDDTYFVKSDTEFLRYRAADANTKSKRSELTFKKKHKAHNNWVRTEVNLRVDNNPPETVKAFAEGLGYYFNFVISKFCDIYFYEDADIVYYSVRDADGKYQNFMEIEVMEGYAKSQEEAKQILTKYEKLLEPLGIVPQNRLRKSLFEMYQIPVSKKGES